MLILFSILWYFMGVTSFIYWWSKDFDFTTNQLGLALLVGFIGPFAFPMGYFIHNASYDKDIKKRILINKRKGN